MKLIAYDGMSMEVHGNELALENTDKNELLRGAGISWSDDEGVECIIVELNIRGQEPYYFSFVSTEDEKVLVSFPQIPITREDT
jgi:hypothetical protein